MVKKSFKPYFLLILSLCTFMPRSTRPDIVVGIAASKIALMGLAAASSVGAGAWVYMKEPLGYRLSTIENDLFPTKMSRYFYAIRKPAFRFHRWRVNDVDCRDGRAWAIANDLLKDRERLMQALVYDLQFSNRISLCVKGRPVTPQFALENNKIVATIYTLNAVRDMCKEELNRLRAYMRSCVWYCPNLFEEFKEVVATDYNIDIDDLLDIDLLSEDQLKQTRKSLEARYAGAADEKEEKAASLFCHVAARFVRLNRIILCVDEYQVERQAQQMITNFYASQQRQLLNGIRPTTTGLTGNMGTPHIAGSSHAIVPVASTVLSNPQAVAVQNAFNTVNAQPLAMNGGNMPNVAHTNALKTAFDTYVQTKRNEWQSPSAQQSQLLRDMHSAQGGLTRVIHDMGLPNPTQTDMGNFWRDVRAVGNQILQIINQAG